MLLAHFQLISCDNHQRIEVNFDCHKTNLYFQCRTQNLEINEGDKNAELLFNSQLSQAPNDIRIENSSIAFIPTHFFENYGELKLFTAINCSIREIYFETFTKATKLHYLVLSSNNIEILPDSAFRSNTNLLTLKLDHNKIQRLTTNAFRGLVTLRTLKLSYNKITHLPLYIFEELELLETLELNNNRIAVISMGQFDINQQLTRIDLSYNEITIIDNGTFESVMESLEELKLEHNKCVNGDYESHDQSKNNLTKLIECCSAVEMESCLEIGGHREEGNGSRAWIFVITFVIFGNLILVAIFVLRRRIMFYWKNRNDDIELNRMIIDHEYSYQYSY